MKAILKFDLEDPDDRMSHLRCIKSLSMAIAIFDLLSKIRYNEKNSEIDGITREQFHEVLEQNGIIIDELII